MLLWAEVDIQKPCLQNSGVKQVYAFDQDEDAITFAGKRLKAILVTD